MLTLLKTIEKALKENKNVCFKDMKIYDIWEIDDNENIGISTNGKIFYYYDYEILNYITIQ